MIDWWGSTNKKDLGTRKKTMSYDFNITEGLKITQNAYYYIIRKAKRKC